jgi:hypothetical protein
VQGHVRSWGETGSHYLRLKPALVTHSCQSVAGLAVMHDTHVCDVIGLWLA